MKKPAIVTCGQCGHKWDIDTASRHSCVEVLQARVKELEKHVDDLERQVDDLGHDLQNVRDSL